MCATWIMNHLRSCRKSGCTKRPWWIAFMLLLIKVSRSLSFASSLSLSFSPSLSLHLALACLLACTLFLFLSLSRYLARSLAHGTYEWVMVHLRMSNVENESWHTDEWVMSQAAARWTRKSSSPPLFYLSPSQIRCVAAWYSMVQCGAVRCIVLQCVAESIESIQLWPVPYSRSSYAACPYMSTPHLCVSYLKTLHAYFNNVHSYLRTSHAFF